MHATAFHLQERGLSVLALARTRAVRSTLAAKGAAVSAPCAPIVVTRRCVDKDGIVTSVKLSTGVELTEATVSAACDVFVHFEGLVEKLTNGSASHACHDSLHGYASVRAHAQELASSANTACPSSCVAPKMGARKLPGNACQCSPLHAMQADLD
jgi:hypothetical protein